MYQQNHYQGFHNNQVKIGYYQPAMVDMYYLQQQQQQQQMQFFQQQQQQQKSIQKNDIFDDVSEEVEQFNVFGVLDESMDLIEFEYNQKQKDNDEDEYSEGSTNNSSSSSHNSSKILEENFQNEDSNYSQFCQEESPANNKNFGEHQINLFSGQNVHVFIESNEGCHYSEEIILFGDEQVVICVSQQQAANYLNNDNIRIVYICPGKEVIVRRALSSYSDSEMINILPINNNSAALRFTASSEEF